MTLPGGYASSFSQTDVENAGDYRIDTILRVSVGHQLNAIGHSDPDRVGPASEG